MQPQHKRLLGAAATGLAAAVAAHVRGAGATASALEE